VAEQIVQHTQQLDVNYLSIGSLQTCLILNIIFENIFNMSSALATLLIGIIVNTPVKV